MQEPDDFEAIYRREWTPVFRLALALTNDWDDAWDIAQDTFRRTWEYYLAYCEAGFRHGAIGDVQLMLERR